MGLDGNVRQAIPLLRKDAAAQVTAAAPADIDLRRLLTVVWRAKWIVALFASAGVLVAYLHLMQITPLYTAESRVLFELDQANVVNLDPVAGSMRGDYFTLASQIEVLKSGRLLERVAKQLDAAHDPVFNAALGPPPNWTRWLSISTLIAEARALLSGRGGDDAAPVELTDEQLLQNMVAVLRGSVSAEWLDGTYVLIIRATTSDPQRSADLANAMAKVYILDQLETKFDATRAATDWLTERVAELRVNLEKAEQAVEDFSADVSLVSEQALGATSRQLKDMRERAAALEADATATAERQKAADAALAAGDYAAVAEQMRAPQLATLAGELARLGDTGTQATRDTLTAQFEKVYRAERAKTGPGIERLTLQAKAVRGSITDLEARVDEQSKSLVQLRQLQREAEASRLIYEFFLSRLKETSVQEGIQRPDARILTEALSGWQSSPRRHMTLGIGGASGAFLALALILLIDRLNVAFRSAEELESRTGHAVIGTVPLAPVSRRRALLQYLVDKPTSAVAESIRNLRTSILLANVDNPPQVIMLTSALPGEGKTTCCIALAEISEALGKRVLLIECDIRRRTFRNYFDIASDSGLLSVLSGARKFDDVVHYDELSGLYILPGEKSTVNAADIFASHRFSDFITEMRKHFDFVFIDTPPVLAVPDARVIAKIADAVIFCVRWNRTARETVIEGLRFFAQINVRVAGLVLTQVNPNKMARYGYTSGYGYYREASKYYHN